MSDATIRSRAALNDLSGYALETLREDRDFILYRGRNHNDGSSVLALGPVEGRFAPDSLKRLEHECSLASELDSSWAVRPRALTHHAGRTLLILEDMGGEPLTRQLAEPLALGRFLHWAVGLAVAVGRLHADGLIHKDIRPANIMVDIATGTVRLMGFGVATRLPRERQAPSSPPDVIAGTLAYMAPEQTGRMNRSIDARSDLYALGVTLYEMLTGTLPFSAADPLEWVHCHIARRPAPPEERRPETPAPLSAIVLKLLAKTAEDRYQTAAGVAFDLRRCLGEWETRGWIEPFALAAHDVPDTLRIPEKLYGREHEVSALSAAFERMVAGGTPELVLLSGGAGIGKSSVVNELHKALVPSRGLFAVGKADQYKRDIPYATLAQAFQNLIQQLLGKSDAEVTAWREALVEAVGLNGQLLVNLIPQLELLIGTQRPVPDLPPQDAQHRFHTVIRRLFGVFARSEHPLVLFLDDLQWIDFATTGLVEHLLSAAEVRHLLLIGAYRNEEVGSSHPLMRTLDVVRSMDARITQIVLKPLSSADVGRMIGDTVSSTFDRVEPLADLVCEKSGGNPFFTSQFLKTLWEENLLKFDNDAAAWSWDLARIRSQGYTDNVVQLMVANLHRLSDESQDALQQLACLGNTADFAALTLLWPGKQATDDLLWDALRAGYVIRLESGYKFAHDRVQEAAYSLIPEQDRPAIHLRIGRLLASRMAPGQIEEDIFEIVNQIDRGIDLITEPEERERVAELNLMAGIRAKSSTAYAAALRYLAAGRQMLVEERWNEQYELTFSLELHTAHCEYLTGTLDAAEERLSSLSRRARTLVDRSAVTSRRLDLYTTLDRIDRAVEVCLEFLHHAGIDWSPHPTLEDVRLEMEGLWRQLGNRSIEELIDLPEMTEPRCRATIDVLAASGSAAVYTDQNLFCLVAGRIANLSLANGNSAASSVGYCWLSMFLGARFNDYRAGLRFGQLALELVQKRGFERFRARVHFIFGSAVSPWTKHATAGRPWLWQAFDLASRQGDLIFAAYSRGQLANNRFASGDPLAEVQQDAEAGLAFARKARFGIVADTITTKRGLIRALRGLTREIASFDDAEFEETRFEQRVQEASGAAIAARWYWFNKLQARYFAGDHASALAAAAKAQALLWTSPFNLEMAEYHFYDALARAAHYAEASADERAVHEEALAAHHAQLDQWARNCPENFRNRELLVAAELARIKGSDLEAMRLYAQAAGAARENGFVQCEALANELAGRFYLDRGLETNGYAHLRHARAGYAQWGADAKVRQLERLYPRLSTQEGGLPPVAIANSPFQQLDVTSVIRASHALSSEILLPRLIETLMTLALESAGANRGLLILPQADAYRIEAEAEIRREKVEVRLCDSLTAGDGCPETVLRYVMRTQKSVIVDDATKPNPLCDETYLNRRQPRSILCLPLIRQGRLSGLLYLENTLTSHAFTPDRVALVELLAGQAAISLENTRLYTDLQERQARIRRLVESNIIGVIFWDLAGSIREANDAFLVLAGYSREDLLCGQIDWKNITPSEHYDAEMGTIQQLQRTGTFAPFEKELICKDSRRIPVLVGGALLQGSQYHGVGFVLDLSERRRAEAEREARQVAEASSRAKSQFLAMMSHELRTPLNGILGYAQILRRDHSLNDQQRAGVEVIYDSGQQLLALINDILDLAKIEASRLDLSPVDISLLRFLRGIADLISVSARQKGLAFSADLDPGLPARIRADEQCLRRVLLNLLSNAVKFTDRGGVRLQVRFSPPARLSFEVRDTGIGIRADQIETIFEPFEQVAEASRRLGGTGLGLTISRRLVRRMGGELQVQSNFGEGSTFWFELEVPVLDQEEEQRAMSAPAVVAGYEGPRRRILVVDDVAYNRAVLIDWLRSAGFDSAEAVNGREALEQAVALRPDLIVMDLIMAEMHGLEAIRSLRQRPYFSKVPIIAISASVSEQDAWKSVQAGADAFLPKPIDLAQLQVQIARLLELKWTYTQTVPRREDRAAPEALVAPPGSEMELLYDLAQQGSMRDIARQAAYVASLDERYCPFAQELQRLAGRYESQAILALIERHREGGSNSS